MRNNPQLFAFWLIPKDNPVNITIILHLFARKGCSVENYKQVTKNQPPYLRFFFSCYKGFKVQVGLPITGTPDSSYWYPVQCIPVPNIYIENKSFLFSPFIKVLRFK